MNDLLYSRSDVLLHHYESNKLHRPNTLNIFITGPRHFADRSYIMASCDRIVKEIMREHKTKHGHKSLKVKIISGMHSPACVIAHDFAMERNFRHEAVSFNSPIGRMGFFARRKVLRHGEILSALKYRASKRCMRFLLQRSCLYFLGLSRAMCFSTCVGYYREYRGSLLHRRKFGYFQPYLFDIFCSVNIPVVDGITLRTCPFSIREF